MNEPVDLLRLPNLHAIETYEEDGALIIKVRAKQPSVGCCLLPRRVKNGVKTFRCRDFAIQGQAVWVEVDRQRYRCSSCGDSPYERFEDLDPDRNLTVRFRKYVEEQVIEHTFAAAARNCKVDESFVRRVFADLAKHTLNNYRPKLPRVLGIDEKHILNGYRMIIGNVESRRMLDFQPTRAAADLRVYFDQFSFTEREEVRVVVQDMYAPYEAITRQFFPRAVTVIDKFHVVSMADRGVDMARRASYLGLKDKQRILLKGQKDLLKIRWDRPGNDEAKGKLWKIFEAYPNLEKVYDLKEKFYKIYDLETRHEAEAALDKWLADLPVEYERAFKELTTALKRWRPHIMRYFEHPYTNAYVENLNRFVKAMNSNAAGMSFDNLRAKLLLKYGDQELKEKERPLRMRMATSFDDFDDDDFGPLETYVLGHGIDLITPIGEI